jgi:hypothetical protein
MPTPAESSSPNSPAVPPASAVSPDVDEHLHGFWKKYGQAAGIAALLILGFYLARAAWIYFADQREASVQAEFAGARTPDQLKAFVGAHPDHTLSGLAELQLADQAYAAGQTSSALSGYNDAARLLKDPALSARAAMGAAMVQIQTGQVDAGSAALHKLLDDTKQLPVVRAQAGYQLASLAAAAGKADEVQRLALQLVQIDKDGPWTKNAFNLTVAKPAAAPAATSIKPAGK